MEGIYIYHIQNGCGLDIDKLFHSVTEVNSLGYCSFLDEFTFQNDVLNNSLKYKLISL